MPWGNPPGFGPSVPAQPGYVSPYADQYGIGPSYGNGPQRPTRPSASRPISATRPPPRPSGPLRPWPGHPGGPARPTEVASGWRSPPVLRPGAPQPRDFRREALLLFPWLANMPELLDAFMQGMIEFNGDSTLAMANMRNHPRYDHYFAGNRRDDGSFRLTEQEYFANMDAYAGVIADAGLNPDLFRPRFVDLIEGDNSPAEFSRDVSALVNGLFNSGPAVSEGISRSLEYYSQAYGVDMTREAVLASYIDENVGHDLLTRRISVSQVGGGAAAFGYQRSRRRVEELMGYGFDTLEESQQFYGTAARRLPTAQGIARRQNDRGVMNIETFESAYLTGGVADQMRLERNLRGEQATYSRRGAAQTDRLGLAFGLADR